MIHRRICSSKIRFLYRCLSTISCSCLEVLLRIQWVKRWALLQTYGSRFFGKVFELHPTHWKFEIIFLFLAYYFFLFQFLFQLISLSLQRKKNTNQLFSWMTNVLFIIHVWRCLSCSNGAMLQSISTKEIFCFFFSFLFEFCTKRKPSERNRGRDR